MPSFQPDEGLGHRGFHDGRAHKCHRQSGAVLDDQGLCEALRERIGIGPAKFLGATRTGFRQISLSQRTRPLRI